MTDYDLYKNSFGNTLRSLRMNRGISQRELAERCSICYTYISKLETDNASTPSVEILSKIAIALEVDVNGFILAAKKIPEELLETIINDKLALSFLKKLPLLDEEDRKKVHSTINSVKNLEAERIKKMKSFEVKITETLEKTVYLEAQDRHEAEELAESNWKKSEYILDADNFKEVKFTAYPSYSKKVEDYAAMTSKEKFVRRCGELLRLAKPNLIECKLIKYNGEDYVQVLCDNGYDYKICIEANSLSGIVLDVFSKMTHK